MHEFDDSLVLFEPGVSRQEKDVFFRMHLSNCGQFLVTRAFVTSPWLNVDNYGILTLRKFTSPEEVTVIHQHKLIRFGTHSQSVMYFINLFVDQNYVILWNKNNRTIQVRSTGNFDVLHLIVFPLNSTLLHYSDGLLMMAIDSNSSSVVK